MGWGLDLNTLKRRFIEDRLAGERSMTELCALYGISRQTGYELMRRYHQDGLDGLAPRSHAPHHVPWTTPPEIGEALIACRLDHPRWGPRKLKAFLERHQPQVRWPAASTIGDLLKREGLVARRRRVRRPLPRTQPFAPVTAANDLWCVDFKGWFRTQDGRRCDPLTVSDAHSRALLGCRICPPTAAGVEQAMERVFREHGLPDRLRLDNGAPWGSRGAGGLTRLSVQWLKLGLGLEFIPPGCRRRTGAMSACTPPSRPRPCGLPPPRRRRSSSGLTGSGGSSTSSGRTRRSGRRLRVMCTSLPGGLGRRGGRR